MPVPGQTTASFLSISERSARGIAAEIEAAISSGVLPPGQLLPSVRTLAAQLGVSPVTVGGAFRELKSRGLVTAQERHRTRVSQRPAIARPLSMPLAENVLDLASDNPDPAFLPDLKAALAGCELPQHLYGGETVFPPLAELACREFQKVDVAADRVCVLSGTFDAVERILSAHLKPGDRVAVEDPCYTGVLDLVRSLGLEPVGCPVDPAGVLPHHFERVLSDGAVAFVLTPRAQNPSGAALTADRAKALKTIIARFPDVLIIEDDHAGPVTTTPYFTLTRKAKHWAVIRSVSKFLGPDIRIALVAGDQVTMARVEGRQLLASGWVSFVLQRLVVSLWSDDQTVRLLERAGRAYTERRDELIASLALHDIPAWGQSGLNVWIPVQEEGVAIRNLLQLGIAVAAGEIFRIQSLPGLRVTSAALPTSQAPDVASRIATALRPSIRRTSRA